MVNRQELCRCLPCAGVAVMLMAAGIAPAAEMPAGPLRADELLLIYNADSNDSKTLAEHYAQVRGVPTERLCAVHVDAKVEEIQRDAFNQKIVTPVRAYIEQRQLREKVRCLVTFYGIPIRVGVQAVTAKQRAWSEGRQKRFLKALDEFERAVGEMEAIGRGTPAQPHPRAPTEKDYQPLLRRYVDVRKAAGERIAKTPQDKAGNEQREALAKWVRETEGVAGVLGLVQSGIGSQLTDEQRREAIGQLMSTQAKANTFFNLDIEDPRRDEAYPLIRQTNGLLGLLAVLDGDMSAFRTQETQAALDSELMLLWWGDSYPKYRWVLNTLNWRFRTDEVLRSRFAADQWVKPVLMVSRIDASSATIARRMIDDAIAAEREGLKGRVYIDARGLDAKDASGMYDQGLRDLAHLLWDKTSLEVRLDNQGGVFGVGKCPEAALYCGWYSLRKYVKSFTFVRGAVGVHIASFEAISLKTPGEGGWCTNLLKEGAAATLGPVAEPYLQSFPSPKEFFGLLLTGRFTLAECYAYSTTFNSWMQMLLGDPL